MMIETGFSRYFTKAWLGACWFLLSTLLFAGVAGERHAGKEQAGLQPPWPYVELDTEQVRKLGHWGYYEKGCAYGAFYALLAPLQEAVGKPYTGIPAHMMTFGRGGVVDEGDLCGSLLGSLAAINLITGDDYEALAEALLTYYCETPLPTDQSNAYARDREFLVDEYHTTKEIEPTVAGSVACRISRRTWMRTARERRRSPARQERCARLTGDVAAHAAKLLNQWAAEKE